MSWESLEIKTAKLSFINSDEELKSLLQNTILFSYLTKQYEPIPLVELLESTQYGYTASASDVGTHLFVRITDIQEGRVNWESVPLCNCERPDNYLLAPNDFLIARTGGTTGKSFLVQSPPDNAVFASYLIRMRFKEDVNVKFIQFFLNSYLFWSQIFELKSGTAQPNVNAEKLKTLLIPDCPFDVQNQIVEAYEAFGTKGDDSVVSSLLNKSSQLFEHLKGIETELTHQQTLLTRLRQSILQEAVQGQLTAQWRQAYPHQAPASELLRRIQAEKMATGKKEKPLPPVKAEEMPFELPEGWVWCRLGEIIELISGQHVEANDYNDNGDGFPYLTGPVDFGELVPIISRWTKKPKVFAIKNDILITVKGSGVGKTNTCNLDKIAIGRQLMAIRACTVSN